MSKNQMDLIRPLQHAVAITPANSVSVGTSGTSEVIFSNTAKTITTTTVDFVAAGVLPGDTIIITGSTANNNSFLVASVAQFVLTLDSGETLTDANPDANAVTFNVTGNTHGNVSSRCVGILTTGGGTINCVMRDAVEDFVVVQFTTTTNEILRIQPHNINTGGTATGIYEIY